MQRVFDGATFAQELGVPRDLDGVSGGGTVAQFAYQPSGGAGRDRGLADDQRGAGEVRGERGSRLKDLR